MVAHERGEEARDRLVALGYPVSWHDYPIQHQVSPEEIQDVGVWLGEVLGADAPGAEAKEDGNPKPEAS
jgi:phospholipase/carboxylesterase